MNNPEVYLHTTHRTVSWFKKAYLDGSLDIAPNFQGNAVWTDIQKSYLIDTILQGMPIPEIYMQDPVDADGDERHIVVDGQQRLRSVLEFVNNELSLEGDDVARKWRGLTFDDLGEAEKKAVFGYKFVARILPAHLSEDEIRGVFSRINKNVESLTDQELRNSTYGGPFIRTVKDIANDDPFWSDCGVFSANDYRRMNDQEFISELMIAHLYGPQNKKDNLDRYYINNEEVFDDRRSILKTFNLVTNEITRILPSLKGTRWRKKSDFYTLFLALAARVDELPFDEDRLASISAKLIELGKAVDAIVRVDENDWGSVPEDVKKYARAVSRAASDRGNRVARTEAFVSYVLGDELRVSERMVSNRNQSAQSEPQV